jgi:hypothetical protein
VRIGLRNSQAILNYVALFGDASRVVVVILEKYTETSNVFLINQSNIKTEVTTGVFRKKSKQRKGKDWGIAVVLNEWWWSSSGPGGKGALRCLMSRLRLTPRQSLDSKEQFEF